MFLLFSAAVIIANLLDLLYAPPRPAREDRLMTQPTIEEPLGRAPQTDTTVPEPAPELSPKSIVRARRRQAAGRAWSSTGATASAWSGWPSWSVRRHGRVRAAARPRERAGRDQGHRHPVLAAQRRVPSGTDESGRSVLALTIWGAGVSLLVGFLASVISVVIGSVVGIAAGHYGRWTDSLLMRVTDWFLVIPFLPLAIVLATVLGPSLANIAFVIGITSWPGTARIVRARALAVTSRPYIERARALGAGDWHLITRHILPNVVPLIFANTVLIVAVAILSETTLAFLGLGDPLRVSWGSMLDAAFTQGGLDRGPGGYLVPPGSASCWWCWPSPMIGQALDRSSTHGCGGGDDGPARVTT